jgi:hypothetical protein
VLRKSFSKNKKSSGEMSGGCLVLFGLPFLAGGLAVAWLYFSGLADWWAARTWVETPCRIVEAELKESRDSESTSYRAAGRYVYRWEGREYESDRVSLVGGSDNVGDYQQRVHRQMEWAVRERKGAALCYVNPRDPGKSVMVRELRPSQMALLSLFALLFPLVGAGVSYGGWRATKRKNAQAKLREAHPDEPWKWHSAWNVSPMPESGWNVSGVLLLVAGWWAVVTVPMLAAAAVDDVFTRPAGFWMLIPGVFFLAALWMVLHQIRERARIGGMSVDVALPLRPGRENSGAWITGKPLRPHDMPVLRIFCLKTVTTQSGNKTSTQTETVWEQEDSLSVIDQTREISTFRLPFRFRLPVDVEETTFDEASTKYEWKLEFRVPGSPVKSVFEVPVWRDPNEPLPERVVVSAESRAVAAEARLPELLEKAKLDATFDGSGLLMTLACGPRRWLASIGFLLVFNVIWTGISVFLWNSDAPIVFKIVWPVTSAGIWLLVFYQMVSKVELRLENGEAHVTKKMLVYRSHVMVPVGEIVSITHGTNSSMNSTHFYWVKLETTIGQRITLASGIAGEAAALGLVRHLERWRKSLGRG